MDENSPATKGDINLLRQVVTVTEESLRRDMATKEDLKVFATKTDLQSLHHSMQEGFRRIHEDIDNVLTVLVNVDKKHTRKTKNHEKRICLLEQTMVS